MGIITLKYFALIKAHEKATKWKIKNWETVFAKLVINGYYLDYIKNTENSLIKIQSN